jgi:hypothetical protein
MSINRTAKTILIAATVALGLSAQTKKEDFEKRAAIESRLASPEKAAVKQALPRDTNMSSLSVYGIWTGITVPAGQVLTLQSQTDYTGADHVSVAVECPTTTSLKSVGLAVSWTNPLANFYAVTDVILGSDLVFGYTGGATVPVYGPQLQISVVNVGTTSIACDQVTTYAVVH